MFAIEVSPTMPLDLACKHVILEHGERQHKLGDSNTFINHNGRVALADDLDVIFSTMGPRLTVKLMGARPLVDASLGATG